MTMRCLHVVPTYLPATRYGGPIYSVHGLCRALAAAGCDVHVYTTNVDGPGVSPVATGIPVDVEGVKVHYFRTGLGRRLYRSPAMAAAFAGTMASFDIVHLHSVFLWPTTVAARLARHFGVPYILAPRGMLVDTLIRRKSRMLKSAWIRAFESANIAGAATIHATSEVERREMEKLGLKARSYAIVPNGVEMPPAGFERSSSSHARPYVLCLGRVNWKKGIERLISAMARVPDADLVIAGNDEDGETARLLQVAGRLGLGNRIRFTGPVHGDGKWMLIRNCAVFALTSYSENFGNVVLEAMACGRPVVVTANVGLADIVEQSGSGLVVDGDPAAIAAAISGLIAAPDRAGRLGEAAALTARNRFSWPTVAAMMCDVYEEAIADAGRRPCRA